MMEPTQMMKAVSRGSTNVFLSLCAVLFITGCASSVPYRYFALQPLVGSHEARTESSIGIVPVTVPAWLDRNHLAYTDGAFQLHLLSQDRWGEPLGEAVTRVLTQNLQRMNPQADVFHGPWLRSQKPDSEIQVEIQNLVLSGKQLELEVSWRINGSRRVDHYKVMINDPVTAVDMARALSEQLSQLSGAIQQAL